MNTEEEKYNSKNEIGIRRYRNMLSLSGLSYIVFGFWSGVEIFVLYTMDPRPMRTFLEQIDVDNDMISLTKAVLAVMIFFFAAIIILVHVLIGRSAVRYSRGRQKSWFFLIPAGFLLYLNVMDTKSYFTRFGSVDFLGVDINALTLDDIVLMIGFVVNNVAVVFVLLSMIFSAVMLIRYSKKKRLEGGTAAHAD